MDTLPDPVIATEPVPFVFNLVTAFCAEVCKHVEGSPDYALLVQADNTAFENFRTAIASTTPQFIPVEDAPDERVAGVGDTSDLDSDDTVRSESSQLSSASSENWKVRRTSNRVMGLKDVRRRIKEYVSQSVCDCSNICSAGEPPESYLTTFLTESR